MNLFRSIYILIIITLFTLPSYSQGFSEIGDQLGISYDFIAKEYGGGVSFVDFNQDGLDDLTFATPGGTPIRFHLNNGSGFTEIDPLVSDTTEVKQVLWVDYNNDGLLDLYITSVFKNRLYKNLGNLSFEDVTDVCGFNDPLLISYCATWFDYNHDGLLDLAVAHRTPEESGFITLYKNLGNEQFQDVTIKSGLKNKGNSVLSMTSFDYNNDGWDDLFLAQDWEQGNQLLENRGNGTFRDVSFIKNANQKMNSMTATIGDFNSDGWFDIYVSNTREGNILLRNDEGNVFTEVSDSLGVQIKSLTFGSVFFDADNDMDLDLMVFGFQINYIYENPGDGSPFIQVNDPWGFSSNRFFNNGVALGDFDGNGFSDVAVSSLTRENFTQGKNTFWKNNFNSNNYLVVDLNGTISNKNAVGARLELTTNGKTIIRRIGCGESYSSQHSNSQYFGVGSNTLIDELIIKWPSGNSSILNNIPANQKISIEEPFGGCMDSNACNYNPNALYDNNSCRYAPLYYDCTGCINDVDEDGVCDELEISGCIDIYSCNFNSEATEDDGSCWYIPTYSIVGDSSVAPLILEEYNYTPTMGSTYEWTVENGTIVLGQGTPNVYVFWLNEGKGTISVNETNTGCVSETIARQVYIFILGNNQLEKYQIQLYPNPTEEYIIIDKGLWAKNDIKITLLNNQGKIIMEKVIADVTEKIDLSDFSNGFYYLSMTNGKETIVSKIVIQK